jgi:cytochrome c biogenesis protein CcmG/thiol:disulfide interchange protein DsbE
VIQHDVLMMFAGMKKGNRCGCLSLDASWKKKEGGGAMRKIYWFFIITAILWGGFAVNTSSTNQSNLEQQPTETTTINASTHVPEIGYQAPAFELTGLDNKTYSLKTLEGKPVVINFWASWCTPCRQEAPEFVKFYDKYHGKLEIYAINLTQNDRYEDVVDFVNDFKFIFPVLLDKKGLAANKYGIQAIPTTFFVNREGVIVDKIIGVADPATLEQKFEKLATD